MSKFKIGDKVKVVDAGRTYTTYNAWAKKHGLTNYAGRPRDCMTYNGLIGVIVAVVHSATERGYLIGIRAEDGKEYIVEDCGLELVTDVNLKDLLTNGRRVKLRNGTMYTVVDGALIRPEDTKLKLAWVSTNDLGEIIGTNSPEWDVMEVYEKPKLVVEYFEYYVPTKVIWQRKEKTAKQLQLEALQKKAQDVADAIEKLRDEE